MHIIDKCLSSLPFLSYDDLDLLSPRFHLLWDGTTGESKPLKSHNIDNMDRYLIMSMRDFFHESGTSGTIGREFKDIYHSIKETTHVLRRMIMPAELSASGIDFEYYHS